MKATIQMYSYEIATFIIGAGTTFMSYLDLHASGIGALTSIVAVFIMFMKFRRD